VAVQVTTGCSAGSATNTAAVSADQPEPDPSDNSSIASTAVTTPCGGADQQAGNGETVTTDPDGTGPDPGNGIFQTSALKIPRGVFGDVAITQSIDGSYSGDCPSLPQVVAKTDQPGSNPGNPLRFTFTYAACTIPPGTVIGDTTFTKSTDGQNYVDVPPCVGKAQPDPCVKKERALPNGNFRYVIQWSGVGDPSWRPHTQH